MPKRIVWDSNGRDGRWVGDDDEVIPDGGRVHVPLMLCDSRRNLTDTFQLDGATLDQFRPGYRVLGDKTVVAHNSIRDPARAEMIDRATNAWRGSTGACAPIDARKRKPDPDEDDDDEENGNGAADGRRRQAHDPHQGSQAQGYDARLDGGRRLRDDPRRPSIEARADYVRRTPLPLPETRTSGLPRANAGHPTRDVTPDEHQARRDKAYQSYCSELSNAWKSPAGQVRPQSALVAPGIESHIEAAADPTGRAAAIEREVERTRGA
jgi:hypothetical protein